MAPKRGNSLFSRSENRIQGRELEAGMVHNLCGKLARILIFFETTQFNFKQVRHE